MKIKRLSYLLRKIAKHKKLELIYNNRCAQIFNAIEPKNNYHDSLWDLIVIEDIDNLDDKNISNKFKNLYKKSMMYKKIWKMYDKILTDKVKCRINLDYAKVKDTISCNDFVRLKLDELKWDYLDIDEDMPYDNDYRKIGD